VKHSKVGEKALNHGFQSSVPDFGCYDAENGNRFLFSDFYFIIIMILFFSQLAVVPESDCTFCHFNLEQYP
jgi:hypothetical protein